MKTITAAGVSMDQGNRLTALGAKYVIPAQAGQPAGWQVGEENEAMARQIIGEKPDPELLIVILGVTDIGYDPGITYYSVTYRIGDGPAQSAPLSELRNAAAGHLTRGMEINPDAIRLYQAAQAAAETHQSKPIVCADGNTFTPPKRNIG